MQLTDNFKLSEAAVSRDYPDLAKLIKFSETDIAKLFYLFILILQPARNVFYEDEFYINSGKRTLELNKAIGGWKNSDHLFRGFSCAVDFTVKDKGKLFRIYDFIYEECLFSIGEVILYLDKTWQPIFIHVSLPTRKHLGRFLYDYNNGQLFGVGEDLPDWVINKIIAEGGDK